MKLWRPEADGEYMPDFVREVEIRRPNFTACLFQKSQDIHHPWPSARMVRMGRNILPLSGRAMNP